ncbi:MAG TPA: serine/threonine-protein kinase [Polyangiaceae bacterium]
MTRPVEPGEIVAGKYEILRRVGKGGMGVVFEARHVTIGRRLAVKFLRSDLGADETRLLRFEREARHCGALHHENITAVLDFAADDAGRPYIVMEFVEGSSLRELIDAEAPLDVTRACELVRQAARGLAAAHDAGILHRDLKPENLMLTRRADGGDWVKLVDFGVARLTEDAGAAVLTREGQTPGTAHYLAPELARAEHSARVSSDVYSLGVVLFELLTGRRPHPDGGYHAVLRHVADERAPAVAQFRPDLPAPLARLVDRMLSHDPAERPESAHALLALLGSAPARNPRSTETVTAPEAVRPVRGQRFARRWSPIALLLLLAVVTAVVVVRRVPTSDVAARVSDARTPGGAEPPGRELVSPGAEVAAPRANPAPAPAASPGRTDHFAARLAPPGRARPVPVPSAFAPSSAPAPNPAATPPLPEPESPVGSFDRHNPFRD